jgi:hypothetical protein
MISYQLVRPFKTLPLNYTWIGIFLSWPLKPETTKCNSLFFLGRMCYNHGGLLSFNSIFYHPDAFHCTGYIHPSVITQYIGDVFIAYRNCFSCDVVTSSGRQSNGTIFHLTQHFWTHTLLFYVYVCFAACFNGAIPSPGKLVMLFQKVFLFFTIKHNNVFIMCNTCYCILCFKLLYLLMIWAWLDVTVLVKIMPSCCCTSRRVSVFSHLA